MSKFEQDIRTFNEMYRMDVNSVPTLKISNPLKQRLIDLKKILIDEINEVDEIIKEVEYLEGMDLSIDEHKNVTLNILTSLADWLGDIQVYAASEMTKFGLPVDKTLDIIMQSNFSKMGADGKPIYDKTNKLLKGPNYWKPEPMIMEELKSRIEAGE